MLILSNRFVLKLDPLILIYSEFMVENGEFRMKIITIQLLLCLPVVDTLKKSFVLCSQHVHCIWRIAYCPSE